MWIIFGKNFSDIVGRMIRGKTQKGKTKAARLVWKYSFSMQLITGIIVGAVLSIAGAFILSRGLGFTHSYFLMWLMGPIFFMRMVSEGYAGYLSGKGYELAAGFGAIIRYTIIFVMGVILSSAVKEYGKKEGTKKNRYFLKKNVKKGASSAFFASVAFAFLNL